MLHKALLISAAALVLSTGTAVAQVNLRPTYATNPEHDFYDKWSGYVSDTSVARFVVNECVIATMGAVTIGVLIATTPVSPVVATAVGVIPEYSPLTIAALSCAGGIAAGVTSAAVAWTWEERDMVGEVMVAQAQNLWQATAYAGATVAATVDYAMKDPVGATQAAVSAVATAVDQGRGLAESTAATVAALLPFPQPVGLPPAYDVASASTRFDGEVWVY